MGARLCLCAVGMLGIAACTRATVDPLGRPCSAQEPCGPGTICDLARGICVAAPGDQRAIDRARDRTADLRTTDLRTADLQTTDLRADLRMPDHPRLTEGGKCPPGLTPCGPVCVDLQNELQHCSACNTPCTKSADRCTGGKCVCGSGGVTCAANQICTTGGCVTDPCYGKQEGQTCDDGLYCTVNEVCKSGACTAGTPRDCSAAGGSCAKGACNEAQKTCVAQPQLDGSPCPGGSCFQGSCCTGCWNGLACASGKSASACGQSGYLCADCTTTECRVLPGTTCGWMGFNMCDAVMPKPSGTPCTGGQCRSAACCTGCWDGYGCRAGSFETHCGAGGALCTDCTSECRTASGCVAKACLGTNKPDGTGCKDGACLGGVCCTGCVDQGSCYSGSSTNHCGVGGASCKSCSTTLSCKKAACTGGSCQVVNASDGSSCSGGTCHSGSCCTGCWDGSACRPGNTDTVCGTAGGACTACVSPAACTAGACQ